jgi:hypothetical protein
MLMALILSGRRAATLAYASARLGARVGVFDRISVTDIVLSPLARLIGGGRMEAGLSAS